MKLVPEIQKPNVAPHVRTKRPLVQEPGVSGEEDGKPISIKQKQDISTPEINPKEVSVLNTSWTPWGTELDNIIIVIAGCDTPFILRKASDGMY